MAIVGVEGDVAVEGRKRRGWYEGKGRCDAGDNDGRKRGI